jgi:hypothetical protein
VSLFRLLCVSSLTNCLVIDLPPKPQILHYLLVPLCNSQLSWLVFLKHRRKLRSTQLLSISRSSTARLPENAWSRSVALPLSKSSIGLADIVSHSAGRRFCRSKSPRYTSLLRSSHRNSKPLHARCWQRFDRSCRSMFVLQYCIVELTSQRLLLTAR